MFIKMSTARRSSSLLSQVQRAQRTQRAHVVRVSSTPTPEAITVSMDRAQYLKALSAHGETFATYGE